MLLFWLLFLSWAKQNVREAEIRTGEKPKGKKIRRKIAIIGAGVTGAATAYYLKQAFEHTGEDVEIVIYEKEAETGGRVFHKKYGPHTVNGGANVALVQNRLISELFATADVEKQFLESGKKMVVWDGEKVRFHTSNSTLVNAWRAWWRGYPLFWNRVKDEAKRLLTNWELIYDKMSKGCAYDQPYDIMEQMKIEGLMGKTAREWLSEVMGQTNATKLWLDAFIDDIAGGVFHSNYNQRMEEAGALVSIVSAIALAADESDVYKPIGSGKMVEMIIKASGAKLNLDTEVRKVETKEVCEKPRQGELVDKIPTCHMLPKLWVTIKNAKANKKRTLMYDEVIIATPLYHASGLELHVKGLPSLSQEKSLKMKKIWTSFVFGRLNGTYFGLEQDYADDIDTVMVPSTSSASRVFNSLGRQGTTEKRLGGLYKFFSHDVVTSDAYSKLFMPKSWKVMGEWQIDAYPLYENGKNSGTNTPFKLADGLWYPSSLESIASAMEISALAARNVANLIMEHGKRRYEDPENVCNHRGAQPKDEL